MRPLSENEQKYFDSPLDRDSFITWYEDVANLGGALSDWDNDRYEAVKNERLERVLTSINTAVDELKREKKML